MGLSRLAGHPLELDGDVYRSEARTNHRNPVAPGKGVLGAFSPPLDDPGNSIRGQRACAYLARALGLNLFASHAEGYDDQGERDEC